MKKSIFLNSNLITIFSLIVGALFLFIGILRQEHIIVLEKAINICLECVGIG